MAATGVAEKIKGVVTAGVNAIGSANRARMKAPDGGNPFLTGIHEPLPSEQTFTELKVQGEIPPALLGQYTRIGPNPLRPDPASHHWFLGDGMVHGVRLEDGEAKWYRNRWIRTDTVSKILGEPRAKGPRGIRTTDVVNTNVLRHAGDIIAIVEGGGLPVVLDNELNTVTHSDFGGTLATPFSAHPHEDPDTGELHTIVYCIEDDTRLYHVVRGTDGLIRRAEPIPVSGGPMVHDCALTENYMIVLDLSIALSIKAAISGYAFPYIWQESRQARIGLLPREGSAAEIKWFDVDPMYIFHPTNAFEDENGSVVMDAPIYPRLFDKQPYGPDRATITYERLTLNPQTGTVNRSMIDDAAQEFPRFDERRCGKSYRYAYTLALGQGGPNALLNGSQLYKHDLESGSRQVRDFGAGYVPAEFVFVPRHENASESEGWLIGYVINSETDTTDLVILNADDFNGEPQAVVHIPQRIPPGFHGNWIPDV